MVDITTRPDLMIMRGTSRGLEKCTMICEDAMADAPIRFFDEVDQRFDRKIAGRKHGIPLGAVSRHHIRKIKSIKIDADCYNIEMNMKKIVLFAIFALLVTVGLSCFLLRGSSAVQMYPTSEQPAKTHLSAEAYHVMYEQGTEAPFTSPLLNEHRKGTFVTADTGLPVFRSEDKYDSGTGWPSFVRPIAGSVIERSDRSLLVERTEIVSADSGAHLGHVFNDGPTDKGGKRYCMNGVALKFIPDDVQ